MDEKTFGNSVQEGKSQEGGRDDRPHVVFEHVFFKKLEDVHFQKSKQNDEPVMIILFDKNEIALPFPGIRKELSLAEDSGDSRMLESIAKSLKYVKGLRIGDPLPKEILTREASWSLSERHVKIAYQRIGMQLIAWMTGDKEQVTDPDQLLTLAEDPRTRKMINQAFGEAADKMGLGRDHKEEVIQYVQTLAHELAYIEALRDRFRHILAMKEKIQGLRRLYGRERSVLEIADQVARLVERAVAEFDGQFLETDAQTGEIIAVLKNLDNQIAYIRDMRDEIYVRLMAWDEVLDEWDRTLVKLSPEKPELLRRAYQFLSPRYMMVNEWVLMTKPRNMGVQSASMMTKPSANAGKPSSFMQW